jgi:hypothetical protein
MIVLADIDPAARLIALAILSRSCSVIAQIVDPLPLKKAPSAPAFSAAEITRGKNGTNFCRNGWCR